MLYGGVGYFYVFDEEFCNNLKQNIESQEFKIDLIKEFEVIEGNNGIILIGMDIDNDAPSGNIIKVEEIEYHHTISGPNEIETAKNLSDPVLQKLFDKHGINDDLGALEFGKYSYCYLSTISNLK